MCACLECYSVFEFMDLDCGRDLDYSNLITWYVFTLAENLYVGNWYKPFFVAVSIMKTEYIVLWDIKEAVWMKDL